MTYFRHDGCFLAVQFFLFRIIPMITTNCTILCQKIVQLCDTSTLGYIIRNCADYIDSSCDRPSELSSR